MAKRIVKYFYGALSKQEEWLNRMSDDGYRLIKTDEVAYEFDSCPSGAYRYKVQFVAEKTQAELLDYQTFLQDLGMRTFTKPLAFGRYSVGAVRWRPYAKGKAQWAKSSGMINKELLIIEKRNDGKPFEIYSDTRDSIVYHKTLLNYHLWGIIFCLLIGSLPFVDFSSMRLRCPDTLWPIPLMAAFAVFLLFFVVNFVRNYVEIRTLKDSQQTYE